MSQTAIGGRQVEIGVGLEALASPGTPVSATHFPMWAQLSLQAIAEKQHLTSARGIRNESSDSDIRRRYSQGDIQIVPSPDQAALWFYLALGQISTQANTPQTGAHKHTITVQNANASIPTSTVQIKEGGIQIERYANIVVNTLNLEVSDGYAMMTTGVLGGFPDGGTLSSSYASETEFSYHQMKAYFGSTVANAYGVKASSQLEVTGATNASADDTVVIGSQTYTFKVTPAAPFQVRIGANAEASLENLFAAINRASGEGTLYGTGTFAHPDVVATASDATTLDIEARDVGTSANALVTTASNANWDWADTTLGGGTGASTAGTGASPKPLRSFSININNNIQLDDAFLSGKNTPHRFHGGNLLITGNYTVLFGDTTELNKYKENTKEACVIVFTGREIVSGATEEVRIKLGRLVLTEAPREYNLDGLVVLNQAFQVEFDATDKEMQVEVINSVASYVS